MKFAGSASTPPKGSAAWMTDTALRSPVRTRGLTEVERNTGGVLWGRRTPPTLTIVPRKLGVMWAKLAKRLCAARLSLYHDNRAISPVQSVGVSCQRTSTP